MAMHQRAAYREKVESGSDSMIMRDNEGLAADNRRLHNDSLD